MIRRVIQWLAAQSEGSEVPRLLRDIEDRDHTIREKDREIRLWQLEATNLAAVAARDLKRVEAETAVYSNRIARETEGLKP